MAFPGGAEVPRAPRYFVDGAYYHVYGRIARGERVFANGDEASRFVEIIKEVKGRDGLTVLAWCVMGNHYHVALRTAAVELWRSIRLVQWRFARQLNRRRRQFGPVWQGRYQARLVDDQRYLLQLIAYIHLNPVSAGLVDDPATYAWSGHRELVGKAGSPLIDVDTTLALFGDRRAAARRTYVRMLRGERAQAWLGERPGRLPWWGGITGDRVDAGAWEAEPPDAATRHPDRVRVDDVRGFVDRAAAHLGVDAKELAGRGKAPGIVRAREIIAIVGVERSGVKVNELAARLEKSPGSVSRWMARAAERRAGDPTFAHRCQEVEAALAQSERGQLRRMV